LALGAFCAGAPAWAQSLSSNLYTGTGTVFIPYTNISQPGVLTAPPAVKVGFENTNGTTDFTMDTGSTGLVVSPDEINTTGLRELGPGQITYSSSGIIQSGNYYETNVNYYNGNNIVATATVPVLVVSAQTCAPHARNCTPNPNPRGVAQMGVGFGQELGGQPGGTPAVNPFLNITHTAAGPLPSRGYVVSTNGVTLGLTAADTQGFAMVKLAPFPEFSVGGTEWVLAPADISVNGTPGTGAVLSDTGVIGMYITPPPNAAVQTKTETQECGADCAAPGTSIQVYLPGQATPVASYGFDLGNVITVGSPPNNQFNDQNGNLLAPAFVSVDPESSSTFVNTTVNFFNGYDYYYDANNGFVGYRYTGAVSPAYGGSTPSIALQGNFTVPDGFETNLPVYLMDYTQVANNTGSGRGFTDQPSEVTLTSSGVSLFAGQISGPGGLEIAGDTVILAAANDYTGATQVDAGATLALLAAGGIASSSGLIDNGTVDLSLTNAGAAIPSLSGNGQVKLGGQTLTLTQAAGTFGGVLADGGVANGVGGGLTVAAGAETLTGASTYTGATMVASGASLTIANTASIGGGAFTDNGLLTVNGALTAKSLTIGNTGTLRGTGTIASPTILAGRLAPGNSPGTLTFAAPVTLAPGSTTEVDIDGTGSATGAGNYSRIIVTGAGNRFTAGGTLVPLLRGITGNAGNAYTPPIGQSFTVVSAAAGIAGSYAGLAQPQGLAAGTRFDTLYAPNFLSLVVTPAAYGNLPGAGIAETSTEAAVGAALDANRPAAGVRIPASQAALYQPLYAQTGAAIPAVLQQLAPTIYADNLMAGRDAWSAVGGTVEQSLDAARGASAAPLMQAAALSGGRRIWMTGLGQFTNVNSQGAPGYSGSAGGVAAGFDAPLGRWLRAGLAFGFTNPNLQDSTGASLGGQDYEFLGYGALQQGVWFADLQAGGGFSVSNIQRPEPAYATKALGKANGNLAGGSIRAGLQLQSGGWQVQPSLSLAGVGLWQSGVTETQGGGTALAIGSSSAASLQTLLGAQLQRRFALHDHTTLTPTAQLFWLHELLDTNAQTAAAFLATGGPAFLVNSPSTGRDAAVFKLGAALDTGKPISLYLAYAGTINGQSTAQDLTGGLSVTW
jgi:autotransporter-associated beta strand protein